MRDFLFYACWLILLPLSFYSAHLGVLLWIWVALLSPADLMYGSLGVVIPFNKIVVVPVVMALVASTGKKKFYWDWFLSIVALYALIVTLSYFLAEHPTASGDFQFDKFWKELLLAVLITGVMHTRHRLHQAALVVSLAFGFVMVKEGLIFLLTAGGHKIAGLGSTGDNNGLALALLMTIPLLLYCARYSAEWWVRLGMYVTAGLGAVTVVATYSRGGFIGLLVLGLMLLRGNKYKVRSIIAVVIFGAILYSLMPSEYLTRIDTIKEASEDTSFSTRLLAWKINFLMALQHPFLGNGLFASLSPENWWGHLTEATTFLFPTPPVERTFVAHSIYFQVLGDTGFTGLFLFLLMLLSALGMTVVTQRRARRDPSLAWAGDLARAVQMSIVVYCVSGAALSAVYVELLYVVLALASRTNRTVRELAAAQPAPARVAARNARRPALAPAYRRAL